MKQIIKLTLLRKFTFAFDVNEYICFESAFNIYLKIRYEQNWGPKDICRYIISLHKDYKVYSIKLEKALIENDVNGEDIQDLTRNDLIPFGITKFAHRTKILNALHKLGQEKEGESTRFM